MKTPLFCCQAATGLQISANAGSYAVSVCGKQHCRQEFHKFVSLGSFLKAPPLPLSTKLPLRKVSIKHQAPNCGLSADWDFHQILGLLPIILSFILEISLRSSTKKTESTQVCSPYCCYKCPQAWNIHAGNHHLSTARKGDIQIAALSMRNIWACNQASKNIGWWSS